MGTGKRFPFVLGFILAAAAFTFAHADSRAGIEAATGADVPLAPSDLQIVDALTALTWIDRSSDEDGFTITIQIDGGVEDTHSVPADTERFELPAGIVRSCGNDLYFTVAAFNQGGASAAAVTAFVGDCAPTPTNNAPVQVPTIVEPARSLPNTGAASGGITTPNVGTGSSSSAVVAWALAGAMALSVTGAALFAVARRRAR